MPAHALSSAERHAAALLQLLGILQHCRLEDDEFDVADCLASVDAEDLTRYDAALAAAAITRWRKPLGIVACVLLRDLDATSHDARVLQIVERGERYGRLSHRLLFWHGDIIDDIEAALARFLSRSAVPGWISPNRLPSHSPRPEFGPTISCVTGDGRLHVVLQLDTDALTAVLDDWLTTFPGAALFGKRGEKRLIRIAQARGGEKPVRWFHGLPADFVIGSLLPGRTARLPSFSALRSTSLDTELQQISDTYAWALFKWPDTMQESVLAFVSSDESIADAWTRALQRRGRLQERVAAYRSIQSLQRHAGGAQFGESRDYGAAALVAAANDTAPPWLIVEVGHCSGHAWRRHTARLSVGAVAVHSESGFPSFVGVYRVDDLDAFQALWQRLDYDDGIASAVVCGLKRPGHVLDVYLASTHCRGFHRCNALSRRLGWIYTHVHGGGCGEHHAMFHARDPATTERVVAFAATQPGWYLSGRW